VIGTLAVPVLERISVRNRCVAGCQSQQPGDGLAGERRQFRFAILLIGHVNRFAPQLAPRSANRKGATKPKTILQGANRIAARACAQGGSRSAQPPLSIRSRWCALSRHSAWQSRGWGHRQGARPARSHGGVGAVRRRPALDVRPPSGPRQSAPDWGPDRTMLMSDSTSPQVSRRASARRRSIAIFTAMR
jgi:hypothetical protein